MTMLVAATLLAPLVPSVLFVGVGQLLANAFYAMGRVKVPALIMPLGMLVFVARPSRFRASSERRGSRSPPLSPPCSSSRLC